MKKLFIYSLFLFLMSCFTINPLSKNNSKSIPIDTIKTKKDTLLDSSKSSIKIQDSTKKVDSNIHVFNYNHGNHREVIQMNKTSDPNILPNNNLLPDEIINPNNNPNKVTKPKDKNKDIIPNVEVKEGKLIYNIPDTMKLGNTYTLRIRINRDVNYLKLTDTLYKQQVVNIKTTSSMEVVVIDPSTDDSKSFSILKQNSDKQFIDDSDYTEWVYSVKPLKSGKLKLNIVISIIKNDNKKEIVYFNSVYVKSDNVVVVETFWEKYWQWIMSTIIIPFIIFIYKKRKNKED